MTGRGMMIVRMFDENRDVGDFLELYQIAFGKPMSKDYFEWKYTKNPFRLNMPPIIVAEENDRVIGARCVVPCRMMIKGNMIYATLGADIMVHPKFRGRGINLNLLKFGLELYRESQYLINFGFPNDMSIRNMIRTGHQLIYKRTSHWKVLNAREVFDKVSHNPVLRAAGGLLSPPLWYKTRVPKLRNQGVTVKEVSDVVILADVYNRWKNADKIYNIRDEKYLNWRFKSHPEKEYRFLAAYAGQEVKGYFVISVAEFRGMKRGTIVDYLVVGDAPNIFEPLLNYALNLFRDNNCALVDTWVFTQKWAQPVVEDYGFISSRNILLRRWFVNNYIMGKPTNEQNFPYGITSMEWYVTPSDSDMY